MSSLHKPPFLLKRALNMSGKMVVCRSFAEATTTRCPCLLWRRHFTVKTSRMHSVGICAQHLWIRMIGIFIERSIKCFKEKRIAGSWTPCSVIWKVHIKIIDYQSAESPRIRLSRVIRPCLSLLILRRISRVLSIIFSTHRTSSKWVNF